VDSVQQPALLARCRERDFNFDLLAQENQGTPDFYIEEVCEDAKPFGLTHKKSPLRLDF